MKYVKTGDVLAVRLDPGEEIIASVLKIAKDEDIRFAEISAIGAVGRAVFGLYDLEEQKYHSLTFVQPLELVSLNAISAARTANLISTFTPRSRTKKAPSSAVT